MEQYERIAPGAAERILRMAELEQSHRHRMEDAVVDAHRRGQRLGVVVAVMALGAAAFAIWRGANWAVPVRWPALPSP
ncbi:MAG: DUF2335 domain-containing protein [Mariprofundaceae bacterium]